MKETASTFTLKSNKCKHRNVLYKRVIVDFYIFKLSMLCTICCDCLEMKREYKRWKIII